MEICDVIASYINFEVYFVRCSFFAHFTKKLITAKFETVLEKTAMSFNRKHFLVCIYVFKVLFSTFKKKI